MELNISNRIFFFMYTLEYSKKNMAIKKKSLSFKIRALRLMLHNSNEKYVCEPWHVWDEKWNRYYTIYFIMREIDKKEAKIRHESKWLLRIHKWRNSMTIEILHAIDKLTLFLCYFLATAHIETCDFFPHHHQFARFLAQLSLMENKC